MITTELDQLELRDIPRRRRREGGGLVSADAASRKRRANDYMREGLARLDPTELIPFFCECGRHRCYQAVWLQAPQFDALRADGRPGRALIGDHGDADVLGRGS
jgi:hypothetical protein